MKKAIIAIAIITLTAIGVWKYLNKQAPNVANKKAELQFTATKFFESINTADSLTIANSYNGKIIEIIAIVKSIENSDSATTFNLGDSISNSTIIATLDKRNNKYPTTIMLNTTVTIKGYLSGIIGTATSKQAEVSVLDDMGINLGQTIQLSRCYITNK